MTTHRDPYTTLGWLATIAVPIAPAFFFGWSVYTEIQTQTNGHTWLAVPIGSLSAFGLEVTGILAGHMLVEFWQRQSYGRAAIAAIILLIYTSLGVIHLQGTVGAIMFLIAPLVYLLVALRHTLTNETAAERDQTQAQRQQTAADRQHQRQLEITQLQLKHQEKLARIQYQASTPPTKSQQEPAPSQQAQHDCQQCGRTFGTVQAVNAHQRFCEPPAAKPTPLTVHSNGHHLQN